MADFRLKNLSRLKTGVSVLFLVATIGCSKPSQPAGGDAGAAVPVQSADPRQRLYDAARREGALVLWGPATDTVSKYFPEEFEKAFPGIKVTGIADNQAPVKLVTEIRAGSHEADALWWPYTGALALHDRGWLAEFSSEELGAFGLEAADADLDRHALKVANFVYGLIYDTRRLKPEALPNTWEQTAAARWKGKVIGSTLLTPFLVSGLGLINGEPWAMDFARRLRASDVTMVPDPLMAMDLLVRGEKELMISTPALALERQTSHHDPVAWGAISPTFATQHLACAIRDGSHPNAARLWALWAASRDGQMAMDKGAFEVSARPGAPTRQASIVAESGVKVTFETVDMVKPRLALYNKIRPVLFGEVR